MIKERDGVEYLVVTDANGHVEVGKGRGTHSGCRSWQHKARKWPHRPWTVGAPLLDGWLRSSGAPQYAVGTCFVTCNAKTEITESVQIVLDPVFDVESDGVIHFL